MASVRRRVRGKTASLTCYQRAWVQADRTSVDKMRFHVNQIVLRLKILNLMVVLRGTRLIGYHTIHWKFSNSEQHRHIYDSKFIKLYVQLNF